jgi:hypothetical protein
MMAMLSRRKNASLAFVLAFVSAFVLAVFAAALLIAPSITEKRPVPLGANWPQFGNL